MNSKHVNGFGRGAFWPLMNVLLIVAIAGGAKLLLFSDTFASARTVTVTGDGKTTVVPDIASLSFSVVTEGVDPETIQKDNTEKMNDIISFVKSQGIEEEDIKTTGYNLYPRYGHDKTCTGYPCPSDFRQRIIGYRIDQTVTVKVRDLANVSAILDGLPSRGANQIYGVNFRVEDPEKFMSVARKEAFTEAREKAEAMAHAAGAKIRRVVTFSENTGGCPILYERAKAMGGENGFTAPLPDIEPGSEEVTVTVSVTYELR